MTYSPQTGRYTTKVRAPLDGVYQVEVVASGFACGGTFDRYAAYAAYVAPPVSGSAPTIGVTPTVPGTGIVTVTLTTVGGKPLGAGFAHLIKVTVSGKGAVSDPIDLGDGTYSFRVYWNPRSKNPKATVIVAGKRRTVSLLKRLKPAARKPEGRRAANRAAKRSKR